MSLQLNAFTGTLDYTGTGGGVTGQTWNIDDFTGQTGTSFTMSFVPAGPILLIVNGLTLRRVGSAPHIGQFTSVGLNITTGLTITATDEIFAVYPT